jgi:hypothetical protein
MQNMKNMQTWTPVAFVVLQQRNKGTRVLFHPSIGLGFNRKQQKQYAEPDIITLELRSACGDSRLADEHPVLAVGLAISFVPSANKKCASDQDVLHAQSGGVYTG